MWPTLSTLLQHILNLVITFVVVYFLAYKPVLTFIQKRKDDLAQAKLDAEGQLQQAQQMQVEYQTLLSNAGASVEQLRAEKEEESRKKSEMVLVDARAEAQHLIEEASKRAASIHAEALIETKKEITEKAMDLASQILQREVSQTDNEKIIDTFFEQVS